MFPPMNADSDRVERLLGALDPEQRQVAETLRGPVRVLAGVLLYVVVLAIFGAIAVTYRRARPALAASAVPPA
jgi:hypothetical protein